MQRERFFGGAGDSHSAIFEALSGTNGPQLYIDPITGTASFSSGADLSGDGNVFTGDITQFST